MPGRLGWGNNALPERAREHVGQTTGHGRRQVRRRARRGGSAVAAVCCLLLLAGCVPQGLAFRVDDRLTITSPKDRAEVTLPLTVSWEIRDFTVVGPGGTTAGDHSGYFAVFVDQAPQPPGKKLSWIVRKDANCRPSEGCPDAEYLATRHIFSTTDTHITFQQLPRPPRSGQKEWHSITVVLLDPAGKRIGESAFQVDVTLDRRGGL